MAQKIYGYMDFQNTNDLINIVSTGDLTGSQLSQLIVTKLRGKTLASSAATTNALMIFDGNNWTSTASWLSNIITNNGLTSSSNGTVFTLGMSNLAGDVTGSSTGTVVTALRTKAISSTAVPSVVGQALRWNGFEWTPSGVTEAGAVTMGGDVTGTSNSNTVIKWRGVSLDPITFTAPSNSAYARYNNVLTQWEAFVPTFIYTTTAAATSWTATHNLHSFVVDVIVWSGSAAGSVQIIPDTISAIDSNNTLITFSPAVSGTALITRL